MVVAYMLYYGTGVVHPVAIICCQIVRYDTKKKKENQPIKTGQVTF